MTEVNLDFSTFLEQAQKMTVADGINIVLLIVAAVCLLLAVTTKITSRKQQSLLRKYRKHVKEEEAERHEVEKLLLEPKDSGLMEYVSPIELFHLLEIREVEDLSLEKRKSIQTVRVSINTNEFSSLIHQMDAEEFFSFINLFMKAAVPMILDAGGIIEEFRGAGMSVLFLKDFEKVLPLTVNLCEMLNELGKNQPHYLEFTVGMNCENTVVGVVGAPGRMNVRTMSEESAELTAWLQTIAEKYYARIILTDTYANLMDNFQKKFNVRLLGYIYIKDMCCVQKIFDVFDGDEQRTRNSKRKTRMVFEKGVALFAKQEYEEARRYFIEVLKTDPNDLAAKEYVYRCELAVKDSNHRVVYIESYG